MTTLALAAPTVPMGSAYTGLKVGAGNSLVLPASEAGTLGANTGFSFPNNGAVLLRIVSGSVAGTLTFVTQQPVEGIATPGILPTIAATTSYIWGPFDTAEWNDVNGLFQALWTGNTGGSVGVYQLPTSRFGQ